MSWQWPEEKLASTGVRGRRVMTWMSEEDYKDLMTVLQRWGGVEEYVDQVAGGIDPEEFVTGIDKSWLDELGVRW